MQQTIRMCTLGVTFHALRAKFSLVEREFVPRLVADYLIVLYQQFDPTLLSAKTAVCLYYLVGYNTGIQPHAGRLRKMRAELFCDRFRLYDKRGHRLRLEICLRMEILAIFDVERAFSQSRINGYRHSCRKHHTLGFRGACKPELALSKR